MKTKMCKTGKTPIGSHVITHQAPPLVWQDGFPIGNGFLGAMVWGDGAPLKMTLDCADLWDSRADNSFWQRPEYNYANLRRLIGEKRYDEAEALFGQGCDKVNTLTPTKISIGRAELQIGPSDNYSCQLDIDSANVTGTGKNAAASTSFAAFVHKRRNVLCLRVTGAPQESELVLKPLSEVCPAMAKLKHPAARRRQDGNLRVFSQEIPGGPCYCVAWSARGPDFFLVVECAENVASAESKAVATWQAAVRDGFDRLQEEHEQAWREFWSVSAVYLPEPALEIMWYYGIYLLASSARRGAMPPGLQGLWAMDGVLPPWRGNYTQDMNVQETFWPAYATGHLDLADSWCDYMFECAAPAQAYTKKVFGTEGTFWPGGTLGKYKLYGGSNWYSMSFGWSHAGWLAWLVWLRWRYSLDAGWLRATGYPVVAEIFKFYQANLVEESDGRLHVPLSSSPEYHGHCARESFCKDPNIDLALIRRCCDWILEMEHALAVSILSPAAEKIKARLVPYALTDKNELCLWPRKPLDESHRHPSSLMAVHPAMDLTIDGDESSRKIIEASVNQFLALGQSLWAGHTYAQLISMAAVLGCAGWAYDSLRQFVEHWVMPNGLHVNSDWRASGVSSFCPIFGRDKYRTRTGAPFTMEANNAVTAGICDMLVQGWSDPSTISTTSAGSGQAGSSISPWNGTVRIFPAAPEQWRDVAFRDLITEGAFKVSAARRQGRTVWVQVTATCDRVLRLRNPFEDAAVTIKGAEARRDGDCYVADLSGGQTLELQLDGAPFDWDQAIQAVREGQPSLLGLPARLRLPSDMTGLMDRMRAMLADNATRALLSSDDRAFIEETLVKADTAIKAKKHGSARRALESPRFLILQERLISLDAQKDVGPFLTQGWKVSNCMQKADDVSHAPPVRMTDKSHGWQALASDDPDSGRISVHALYGERDGLVYLANRIKAPKTGRIEVRLGHDGGARLFIDGQSVLCDPQSKTGITPDRSRATINLAEGEHEMVVALDLARGAGWGLRLRFAVADGKPMRGRDFPFPVLD